MKGPAPRPARLDRGAACPPAPGLLAPARRGFTLVEILLTLALLALFATLFLPGVNSMVSAMNERSAEQQLAEAVLAARSEALETGRTVDLTFAAEPRQLRWGLADARAEPLPSGATLEFLPMQAGGSILLGGVLTENQEPLRRVRFFPDGTCEAFRIRLRESERAPARLFVVDPWTCAVNPVAPKGGP